MLKRCIDFLFKQDYKDISIVVVEDGCTDGTVEYLNALALEDKRLHVLHGSGELWWGGSMRLGMEYVLKNGQGGDYLLMLNDDIEFDKKFISTLVDESRKRKNAVVGAMQQGFNGRWGGFVVNYLKATILPAKGIEAYEVDALPGRGVVFPYDAVVTAGVVNDARYRQYMGDIEYSARVKEKGWKLWVSVHAEIKTDPETSDVEIQKQGFWVKLFSFKSKTNLQDRILFFSTRGAYWLRPWAFVRVIVMGVWRMLFSGKRV